MTSSTQAQAGASGDWTRHVLAFFSYVLPTFPLGYFWHLTTFREYYESLEVYRADILIPLGLASMAVQGVVWTFVYSRLFAPLGFWRGAAGFAAVAAPLAWSFQVSAVAAKHHMASVSGYVAIETAFIAVHYVVVSPLMSMAYTFGRPRQRAGGPHEQSKCAVTP